MCLHLLGVYDFVFAINTNNPSTSCGDTYLTTTKSAVLRTEDTD